MAEMSKAIKAQIMARTIIADLLLELAPKWTREGHLKNADALIARLAAHDPPLLICTEDEIKE